jgi:hypothetical protein
MFKSIYVLAHICSKYYQKNVRKTYLARIVHTFNKCLSRNVIHKAWNMSVEFQSLLSFLVDKTTLMGGVIRTLPPEFVGGSRWVHCV